MKIAIATDDKKNITTHFGGCKNLLIVNIEEAQVTNRENRTKLSHHDYALQEHAPQTDVHGKHGYGEYAGERHKAMLENFKDCDALIVNLIGTGAFNYFQGAGVNVIATGIKDVEDVIEKYIQGDLIHNNMYLD